jgi:hypothetical protein
MPILALFDGGRTLRPWSPLMTARWRTLRASPSTNPEGRCMSSLRARTARWSWISGRTRRTSTVWWTTPSSSGTSRRRIGQASRRSRSFRYTPPCRETQGPVALPYLTASTPFRPVAGGSWRMPQNFLACDREQPLLLPQDLRDWLPRGRRLPLDLRQPGPGRRSLAFGSATSWCSLICSAACSALCGGGPRRGGGRRARRDHARRLGLEPCEPKL